ncbi:hypothetical protein MAFF211491_03930 [Ralstonia solanacearum]|nr:hypothetical protein MAFF211491_03930 [Ralstonia solanacearum]BCM11255.1 hypothetical protein MAFF241648_04450 [Ralstonia solanacearum]
MFRSTLKLSLMMLVAGAIAVQALSWSAGWLFHDTLTQGQREGRKGYVFLLREYLDRFPGEARATAIQRLNNNATELFDMVELDTVADLSTEQRRDLADGKLVVMTNRMDYYLPLRDGTVLHARFEDIGYYTAIKIIAFCLIAIATLLPILFWSWLLWRDLRALEEAARGFGGGMLSTRAHLRRGSNVHALARQFNDMAERIQGSIQHQREMMNGISHELKTPIARLEFGIALLQSPVPEDQRKARFDALRSDVRELDELVTELLALSRLEQGATHLVLMRVTVGEWLDSVVANIADDVADRQLTLAVHADFAPAHHVCDPRLVARAAQPDPQCHALCAPGHHRARRGRHLRQPVPDGGRRWPRHSRRRARARVRAVLPARRQPRPPYRRLRPGPGDRAADRAGARRRGAARYGRLGRRPLCPAAAGDAAADAVGPRHHAACASGPGRCRNALGLWPKARRNIAENALWLL